MVDGDDTTILASMEMGESEMKRFEEKKELAIYARMTGGAFRF